jgi:NAD(P)-dependent dehydrogenase (short-subunit alcohol dehydrogenase family)
MKSALITGANKGIGLATAKELLQNGVYVYLGSRNFERGLQVVEEFKRERLQGVEAIPLDVTDSNSVTKAFDLIAKKLTTLTFLLTMLE